MGLGFLSYVSIAHPQGTRGKGSTGTWSSSRLLHMSNKGLCLWSKSALWHTDVLACKSGKISDPLQLVTKSPEKASRNQALSLAGSFAPLHQSLPKRVKQNDLCEALHVQAICFFAFPFLSEVPPHYNLVLWTTKWKLLKKWLISHWRTIMNKHHDQAVLTWKILICLLRM